MSGAKPAPREVGRDGAQLVVNRMRFRIRRADRLDDGSVRLECADVGAVAVRYVARGDGLFFDARHGAFRLINARPLRPFKCTPGTCRVCGCTDAPACPAGCWWVIADLCSNCEIRGTSPASLWSWMSEAAALGAGAEQARGP